MLGCSTQTHPATVQAILLQLTESTNKPRNVNTGSASEKSSMECSPLWYNRWHGPRSYDILQIPCRYDSTEATAAIPDGNGMAKMKTIVRLTQSLH